MHPGWARSLRNQCAAAGVPFFFKQWGEWAPFATTAYYAKDDVVGGDCGGPEQLSFIQDDRGRKIPYGFCIARWHDGRQSRCEKREEPEHRWGKNDGLRMTYLRVGKKAAGRLLDGREHSEFPA